MRSNEPRIFLAVLLLVCWGCSSSAESPDETNQGVVRALACDSGHVWDTSARDCRLYPGGPNGWAGCSMSTHPPSGEACVTGTHWVGPACDCVCDAPNQRWDDNDLDCVDVK